MFGHKEAGLLDALLHGRAHDGAAKTKKPGNAEARVADTPADVLLRRETYFAVASAFRWNR